MGGSSPCHPHDTEKLLEFCIIPRNRQEIMEYMEISDRKHFREYYLNHCLNQVLSL